VGKKNFPKEDKVKAVLKERGTHPGLVWVFSALEPCTTWSLNEAEYATDLVFHRQTDLQAIYGKFGTMRSEIGHLSAWLQHRVSEVVMESTAQYWRPVW
jgi:hypothetical protein